MYNSLEGTNIDMWTDLEMSSERRKELMDSDEFFGQLRRLNGHHFNQHRFRDLLHTATDTSNNIAHTDPVSTQTMRNAAADGTEILRMICQRAEPEEDHLKQIREELYDWDDHTARWRHRRQEALRNAQEPIKLALLRETESRHEIHCLKDELRSVSRRVLKDGHDENHELGHDFNKHLRRVFRGDSTRTFRFPEFQEPVYPDAPFEDAEDRGNDAGPTTQNGHKRKSDDAEDTDDADVMTEDQPLSKKRKGGGGLIQRPKTWQEWAAAQEEELGDFAQYANFDISLTVTLKQVQERSLAAESADQRAWRDGRE